jgi:pantoate--beta-alanine ligase
VLAEVPGVATDYFGALDPETSQPVPDDHQGDVIVAVAARVGATRLIDNIPTRVGPPSTATTNATQGGDS